MNKAPLKSGPCLFQGSLAAWFADNPGTPRGVFTPAEMALFRLHVDINNSEKGNL